MVSLHQVISAHGPALARLASSYERDPALAEELLQEILFAIHQSLPRLREPERAKAFVFRIAHNRALSHVVTRMREPRAEAEAEIEAVACDGPTPEGEVALRQAGARLAAAVRALPLPYRQVMVLVLEDFTYEEIADTLAISVSNVGARVNRAKTQLRTMLHHD